VKPWSDFYDLVLPDVPSCTTAMADMVLRQSAISFCEQSLAWKYDHSPISVLAGLSEYGFVLSPGTAVHMVAYAALDGRELNVCTGEAEAESWRSLTGRPEYVSGRNITLALLPTPDSPGLLTLKVVLKPSPSAAGIDDGIFDEYREAITHGALARLMLSPRKPYTNVQLAQYHAQQFAIHAADAGTRAIRNHSRAPLQTGIMRRP
jgi:hypothetical protein